VGIRRSHLQRLNQQKLWKDTETGTFCKNNYLDILNALQSTHSNFYVTYSTVAARVPREDGISDTNPEMDVTRDLHISCLVVYSLVRVVDSRVTR
jgi:hypothetical protein